MSIIINLTGALKNVIPKVIKNVTSSLWDYSSNPRQISSSVPVDSGRLGNSARDEANFASGILLFDVPYASAMYYGIDIKFKKAGAKTEWVEWTFNNDGTFKSSLKDIEKIIVEGLQNELFIK